MSVEGMYFSQYCRLDICQNKLLQAAILLTILGIFSGLKFIMCITKDQWKGHVWKP
jgi:uncharacterized MnhB-related membrane protein